MEGPDAPAHLIRKSGTGFTGCNLETNDLLDTERAAKHIRTRSSWTADPAIWAWERYVLKQFLRILIVEDDALIAMDLADLLIGLGHDVYAIASNEDDAVAQAARLRPDLMIVDGHLREGSGVAAVNRILSEGFVAHVFVTGDPHGVQDLASDAIIVAKPFSVPTLLNGIRRARQAAMTQPEPGATGL